MVMKRYPHGAAGEFFFMKRAPSPRPDWIEICSIEHASGNVIDFPIVQDLASLLWVVNLGCIDLNQWYARCDDIDRPDYLHFDLDPVPDAGFERVLETALRGARSARRARRSRSYAKTTGSRGIHVYVPIVRGPTQKQVWTFAKALARSARGAPVPRLITAEYRVAQAAGGPRAGGLQPERLGPHAGLGLLRAPAPPGHGLDAGDLGGGRSAASASRTSAWTTCRSACASWATSGSPSLRSRGRLRLEQFLMNLPIAPPYPPMEALVRGELPEGAEWQYEPKWDGFRCLAFRDGEEIELQSKAGQPLARYFPEMVERRCAALPAERFVLDGELVIPIEGRLSFDDLLLRIHPAESRVRRSSPPSIPAC